MLLTCTRQLSFCKALWRNYEQMIVCPDHCSSAAVTAALVAWTGVVVTILMIRWSKPDKRFDDLKAEIQEDRAETGALKEALFPAKA